MVLEEEFKRASETGKPVIILKSIGQCDCFDPSDLLNSEPDPHCEKCYGTGKERLKITTEKLRYDYSSNSLNYEKIDSGLVDSTSENFTFYMPFIYKQLNNEDIIITTDSNGKFFEVTNKFEYCHNEFSYLEVIGKKIPFLSGFKYE